MRETRLGKGTHLGGVGVAAVRLARALLADESDEAPENGAAAADVGGLAGAGVDLGGAAAALAAGGDGRGGHGDGQDGEDAGELHFDGGGGKGCLKEAGMWMVVCCWGVELEVKLRC